MPRFTPEELERLKQEVSLVRLVQADGIELHGQGENLVGRCPRHEDHTPSLVISPSKNLWHCMGACQEGGDVITWVMRSRKVSFRHAVELLRGDYVPLPAAKVIEGGRSRMLPSVVQKDAADQEVFGQVVNYYHQVLKQTPRALEYLQQTRGLVSPEMVDGFKLGFANRTLAYHLPVAHRVEGSATRARLQKIGLIRQNGYEHFDGCLVVPIWNEHGQVLGMYGRKISSASNLRKGTPLHMYLPGLHRGVFNVEVLESSKTVILCEAIIDALTFWCAGFRNVTASYGVSGFTAEHLEAFKRHRTERVLIAYDRDDAGDKAAESLAEKLIGEGIECFRVQFPRGMDANEYAKKVSPAAKSLGVLVRHAVWLGKGKATVDLASLVASEQTAVVEVVPSLPAPPAEEASAPVAAEAATPAQAAADTTDRAGEADERREDLPAAQPLAPQPRTTTAAPPRPLAAKAAADPQPAESARATVPAEVSAEEVRISLADRRYRIRGLGKSLSFEQMRVNVLAGRGEGFHVDTLDLYSHKQRQAFVKQASFEMKIGEETVKQDLGLVLLKLEELQKENIHQALEPKQKPPVVLSEDDERAALELLRDPRLIERILADFAACGIVGEETNKLVGFLAAISRKLEEPLAVIIQSSSSAGKTALMEAVLALMPEEDRIKYSAMTGQSLFYMGETDLKHKILAIVEEQGAEKASYALKLLQSEGELTIASTGKDAATGRLVTHEYRVEGPVMIFLTTTSVEVDEELLNRCLVLSVDEDREQTRAIHERQRERETLEGLLGRKSRPSVLKVQQDAQRLLRPLLVANPYARYLTFLDDQTRTRRDHVKYLTLIRTIALLHQYQRPTKTVEHRGGVVPYIEVTLADIELANRLTHQVLGRSLDELPPQTRRLLMQIEALVAEESASSKVERGEVRFTRRQVRERLNCGNSQLKLHLSRLDEMEYIQMHRSERGGICYELVYDGGGKDGRPFLSGLLDVEKLKQPAADGARPGFSPTWPGLSADRPGSGRGPAGPWPGGGRTVENVVSPRTGAAEMDAAEIQAEKSLLGPENHARSRQPQAVSG